MTDASNIDERLDRLEKMLAIALLFNLDTMARHFTAAQREEAARLLIGRLKTERRDALLDSLLACLSKRRPVLDVVESKAVQSPDFGQRINFGV